MHLLQPPHRGQPAQPTRTAVTARVADQPENERDPQHGNGNRCDSTGVLSELRGRGRDSGEHDAGQPEREAGQQRPVRRQVLPGQTERDQDCDNKVRACREDQRRHHRGVPADHGRADQLQPPGFFVLPGVPVDRHDAHQRDQQSADDRDAPHRHGTQ
jgi:hypothetical protein